MIEDALLMTSRYLEATEKVLEQEGEIEELKGLIEHGHLFVY